MNQRSVHTGDLCRDGTNVALTFMLVSTFEC